MTRGISNRWSTDSSSDWCQNISIGSIESVQQSAGISFLLPQNNLNKSRRVGREFPFHKCHRVSVWVALFSFSWGAIASHGMHTKRKRVATEGTEFFPLFFAAISILKHKNEKTFQSSTFVRSGSRALILTFPRLLRPPLELLGIQTPFRLVYRAWSAWADSAAWQKTKRSNWKSNWPIRESRRPLWRDQADLIAGVHSDNRAQTKRRWNLKELGRHIAGTTFGTRTWTFFMQMLQLRGEWQSRGIQMHRGTSAQKMSPGKFLFINQTGFVFNKYSCYLYSANRKIISFLPAPINRNITMRLSAHPKTNQKSNQKW